MKWCKVIQNNSEIEWKTEYISYKFLKKIIGNLKNFGNNNSNNTCNNNNNNYELNCKTLELKFKSIIENDIDRVALFYNKKEREILDEYNKSKIPNNLRKLDRYAFLNAEGFRKILKKWDKTIGKFKLFKYKLRCMTNIYLPRIISLNFYYHVKIHQLRIKIGDNVSQKMHCIQDLNLPYKIYSMMKFRNNNENGIYTSNSNDNIGVNGYNKKSKVYMCNYCDKKFEYNYSLTRHLKSHKIDRPWICDVCNKGFKRKQGLVQHKKIHAQKVSTLASLKQLLLKSQNKKKDVPIGIKSERSNIIKKEHSKNIVKRENNSDMKTIESINSNDIKKIKIDSSITNTCIKNSNNNNHNIGINNNASQSNITTVQPIFSVPDPTKYNYGLPIMNSIQIINTNPVPVLFPINNFPFIPPVQIPQINLGLQNAVFESVNHVCGV